MDLKDRILAYINYLHISVSEFERNSGLSNGYIKNFKGQLGVEKLENILKAYPELSYSWLVRGEGEMLKTGVQQISYGDMSPNLNGKGNSVNFVSEDLKIFVEELSAQRRISERTLTLLEKKDEQIDRLISIIEKQR